MHHASLLLSLSPKVSSIPSHFHLLLFVHQEGEGYRQPERDGRRLTMIVVILKYTLLGAGRIVSLCFVLRSGERKIPNLFGSSRYCTNMQVRSSQGMTDSPGDCTTWVVDGEDVVDLLCFRSTCHPPLVNNACFFLSGEYLIHPYFMSTERTAGTR